jgi:hypothetical protein
MFRIMSVATLVMIAVCFFVGVSLAFADELPVTQGTEQINDASRPVETTFEDNLAQNDVYDFSDYLSQPSTVSTVPPVDAEKIEEPELDRFEQMDA